MPRSQSSWTAGTARNKGLFSEFAVRSALPSVAAVVNCYFKDEARQIA
jgi:hypothetical protein